MMKRITFLVLAFCWVGFSQSNHLLITEIVLQPSDGEYIKIFNPTDQPIDLSDYYITDATDTLAKKFYYNLPSGQNYWSGTGSDFIARFPSGFSISPHAEITITLRTKSIFQSQYGYLPDLSLREDFRPAIAGANTIGSAPDLLANTQEGLILFYWDGTSATIKDVDYVLWGGLLCAVNKTNVPGYNPDTPINQQKFLQPHSSGEKLQRVGGEGAEVTSGGNGITGHDETSEDFQNTWRIVKITNTKPKISNIVITPSAPIETDSITFLATVTDDSSVKKVNLKTRFKNTWNTTPMLLVGNDIYQAKLAPLNVSDTLYYYIQAEDITGLKDSTALAAIFIAPKPVVLTIKTIRDNWSQYNGQIVTLRGVVTIGSNVLITNRTSAYFQDFSGRGLNLYASAVTNLKQGDSIEVTGRLTEYSNVKELTDWTNSYTVIASGVPIRSVNKLKISQIISNLSELEGSFVEIKGTVADRTNPTTTNTGCNITLEDETGKTTIRIWNTTGVIYNALGQLVNRYTDSLLSVGNKVVIRGVVGIYNNAPQILLGYASDVEPYIEGQPGVEKISFKVAPFPFVPQLGEVIKYTYEYPSNSRVILRVYDQAGRFITTLIDEYYAVSWQKDGYWNGRNEINELVPPGTYYFYYEVTNRTTGKTVSKVAPVVVGVKLK